MKPEHQQPVSQEVAIFYIARLYEYMKPSIIECLTDESRAKMLAKILSEEKKEQYIVLKPI